MSIKPISDPFDMLQRIADRSLLLARPLPTLATAEKWGGIKIRLGKKAFLVPLSGVTEILQAPSITSLPGVKPWVYGVSNLRGRLFCVSDLNAFLYQVPPSEDSKKQVLYYADRVGSYGFAVDEIMGLAFLEQDDVIAAAAKAPAWVKEGRHFGNKKSWPVIDLQQVIAEKGFLEIGS